jgi:hypothetical protein
MGTIVGVGTSSFGSALQLTKLTISDNGTLLTVRFPLEIDDIDPSFQIFLTEDTSVATVAD